MDFDLATVLVSGFRTFIHPINMKIKFDIGIHTYIHKVSGFRMWDGS